MKKLVLVGLLAASINGFSQLTTVADGGNKPAWVGERIGLTDVTIHYSRPAVKGREGSIYGKLVQHGYNDLGFGTSKAAPWRAGANENTTIEFSTDVKVEGKDLPAGKYAFFVATDPNESTLIFSKNNSSWGSFYYDEKEDALRVKVKPVVENTSTEWLKYEFTNESANSATVNLVWEKWRIPFKVETDVNKVQMESFRRELRSDKGFTWRAINQAAQYTIDNNIELEQGLQWADQSISSPFIGQANFATLSTKAQILSKLGKTAEADEIMKKALPLGTMNEIHAYARQLLIQKKGKEAFDAFKLNYDKNPNVFTTNMGLARGYSATGEYKKALEFAKKALPQAPDAGNKVNVEKIITMLQEGKDINQ
jgi:tetratricopeptide (TPR) repeat protein